jgi:hypothetical protein
MVASPAKLSYLIGVRLTREDKEKLATLCAHAQRQPGDLVRTLIRLAAPVNMPPAVPIEVVAEREGVGTTKEEAG